MSRFLHLSQKASEINPTAILRTLVFFDNFRITRNIFSCKISRVFNLNFCRRAFAQRPKHLSNNTEELSLLSKKVYRIQNSHTSFLFHIKTSTPAIPAWRRYTTERFTYAR